MKGRLAALRLAFSDYASAHEGRAPASSTSSSPRSASRWSPSSGPASPSTRTTSARASSCSPTAPAPTPASGRWPRARPSSSTARTPTRAAASGPPTDELPPHSWYPVVSLIFAGLWAVLPAAEGRGRLLSLWAALLAVGLARHASILVCFEDCAYAVAAAFLVAAPVFRFQSRRGGGAPWTPARCRVASGAAALWAAWLALTGLGLSPWLTDMIFACAALALWLGRARADWLLLSAGTLCLVLGRETVGTAGRLALGSVVAGASIYFVDALQAALDARPRPSFRAPCASAAPWPCASSSSSTSSAPSSS
ncbi:MAG: hypothetical protein M0D55_20535 [Elusimicrobiota bacterium]|nr:MAG: hypothetical protein M0D55_20535 [Elusimicrobiota bacterium]